MKKIISRIILIACAAAVAFCGWNIYQSYQDIHREKDSVNQFVTQVNASDSDQKITSPVSFSQLHDQNTDYRGWIWFDSNLISLPIVQSDSNDYYLRKNLNKEYDVYGTPFIDAANSLTDQNVTIYGHSSHKEDAGMMFTPLKVLLEQQSFDQNQRFHIDWEGGIKTYQIFAVCNINVAEDTWNYTQNIFQTDEDFYEYVHAARKHSAVSADIDVAATDSLITLQTCSEDGSENRTVIIAKEIK